MSLHILPIRRVCYDPIWSGLSIIQPSVLVFCSIRKSLQFSPPSMPGARSFPLFWVTILLLCLPRADAQEAPGITVGAPKAFDNRTLNLMLERLNTQLAGINVIDQKSLAQAIGAVQGSSAQDTSSSLSVQGGLPTPAGQAQNSSSANSSTNPTQRSASNSSATPSPSALPDMIATPGATLGLAAIGAGFQYTKCLWLVATGISAVFGS